MAYSPTTWVNGSLPGLDATHLNKIEAGIQTAQATADAAAFSSLAVASTVTSGFTVAGWPAAVKWASGSAPVFSTGVGVSKAITLNYDGTDWIGD